MSACERSKDLVSNVGPYLQNTNVCGREEIYLKQNTYRPIDLKSEVLT